MSYWVGCGTFECPRRPSDTREQYPCRPCQARKAVREAEAALLAALTTETTDNG